MLVKAKLINVAHVIFAFVARSFGKRVLNNSIKNLQKNKEEEEEKKTKEKNSLRLILVVVSKSLRTVLR